MYCNLICLNLAIYQVHLSCVNNHLRHVSMVLNYPSIWMYFSYLNILLFKHRDCLQNFTITMNIVKIIYVHKFLIFLKYVLSSRTTSSKFMNVLCF